VREALANKVEKIRRITALLPTLGKPHTEYCLLRSCLALPKIIFTLRTVDTSECQDILQEFDDTIRESLIRIMGAPVTDRQWLQARLPTGQGGLGLRGAVDTAGAAYAASYISAQPLVNEQLGRQDTPLTLPTSVLDSINMHTGEEVTTEELEGLSQKMLSAKIDDQNLATLKEQIGQEESEREMARLASLGLPYAGAWLDATPLAALGLYMHPSEFVMAARYRLGIPVYDREGPCPACLRLSDRLGDHALCCGHQGERISRHNRLRDAIHDVAAAAALSPAKESRFLLPGVDRRPADIYIPSWAAGRDAALDVTVVNSLQSALVAGAAATPGHALDHRYGTKMTESAEDCRREGIAFLPLVVETLGGWHKVAIGEVKKLAAALARHTGEDEGDSARRTWVKLAILLQKGNAALLSNRIPTRLDIL
jgi:hypothetical protein